MDDGVKQSKQAADTAAMGTERVHPNGGPEPATLETREADRDAPGPTYLGRGPSCENCGGEAAGEAVAHNILLCDRCRSRYRLVVVAHSIISWLAVFGIVFVAMPRLLASATRNPLLGQQPSSVLTARDLLVFYVSLAVGVLVHECSHAACASGFGFTVTQIHLGTGRVLYRRKAGDLVAVLHIAPFGGVTMWRPDATPVTPAKRAAVAFAGPLSNLALAALCWAARSYQPAIAIPAACANLLLFIENVAPRPYSLKSGNANDGWQILKNLTKSHWARTHARRLELVNRCVAAERDGRTSEAIGQLRSDIEKAGGDYPDAEALLCVLLLSPRESQANIGEGFQRSSRLVHDQRAFPGLRAMALNHRAFMLAVGGWPHLMAEAEWAAREALRENPDKMWRRGTLAIVLFRLGRFDEAERIVGEVVQHDLKAVRDAKGAQLVNLAKNAAANRCTLALLHAHTNRRDAAQRELAGVRSLDTNCVLLPELERVLAAGPNAGVPAGEADLPGRPQVRPPSHPIVVLGPAASRTLGGGVAVSVDYSRAGRVAHR